MLVYNYNYKYEFPKTCNLPNIPNCLKQSASPLRAHGFVLHLIFFLTVIYFVVVLFFLVVVITFTLTKVFEAVLVLTMAVNWANEVCFAVLFDAPTIFQVVLVRLFAKCVGANVVGRQATARRGGRFGGTRSIGV